MAQHKSAAARLSTVAEPPLVVDLDGTLVKGDLLAQSFFALLSARPFRALCALAALCRGKAAFKSAVAADASVDCNALPFNPELLALLRTERA